MKMNHPWVFALVLLWPILSHAQLTFPPSLKNELDGSPIDDSARDVVVLIHGWTAKSSVPVGYNRYEAAEELYYLVNILKLKLAGSSKTLVTYHWEKDASTGIIEWNPPTIPAVALGNATQAAINANGHGANLGSQLHAAAKTLRTVQFIAHSAGTWCALEAANVLLKKNPYAIVQITLLDPFIPEEVALSGGLFSKTAVQEATGWPASDRIYRMENYFAEDTPCLNGLICWNVKKAAFPTFGTQTPFSWRNERDINIRVDWGFDPALLYSRYYDYHSGPIEFYADTVAATVQGQQVPVGLVGGILSGTIPFQFTQVGWYRSIFYEDFLQPRITSQPQSLTVTLGDKATFSVSANRAVSFQWFKNGQQYSATGPAFTLSSVSASDAGEYVVRVTNANGQTFSEIAKLHITSSPSPTITSVSPTTLSPSASPQIITIIGTGFKQPSDPNASSLIFYDPANNIYPRSPINVTATSMQCGIIVQAATGTWKVKVVNGGVESLPYSFDVNSVPAQLTGLSITGPISIIEKTSRNFTATASYSDGSTQVVSPTWTADLTSASISIFGVLSAGEVSSDTSVTISASYTVGTVTVGATKAVSLLDTANPPTQVIALSGDLSFGNVLVGETKQRTLTIANTGSAPLTVSGISYPKGFSGDWDGMILAGNSHDVILSFSPTTLGSYSGIIFVDFDSNGGNNTLRVTGIGTANVGLPTVETLPATHVTSSSAVLHGTVRSNGESEIIDWMFHWGRTTPLAHAQLKESISVVGNDFTATITGLLPNTTYFFRAWARNGSSQTGSEQLPGWGIGSELKFTTDDIDSRDPASAFKDDFNRLNSPTVGNGWFPTIGNQGQLEIIDGELSSRVEGARAGIYRQLSMAPPLVVLATLKEANSTSGARSYQSGFFIHNDGVINYGYGIWVSQSNDRTENAEVRLYDGYTLVKRSNCPFMFGPEITLEILFNPDGSVRGSITQPGQSFLFQFDPYILKNTGPNFAFVTAMSEGPPHSRLDNLVLLGVPRQPSFNELTASNGVFTFGLHGLVGSKYIVEASSDLVKWIPFATNTIPTNGMFSITDLDSLQQVKRFYRASLERVAIAGAITNSANGHKYVLLNPGSWTESEAAAVSLGGHLVTISDDEENAWLCKTFPQPRFIWIGLNDSVREGNLVWSSGEQVSHRNWDPGEPSQINADEDFVYILNTPGNQRWNDDRDVNSVGPWPIFGVAEIE